MRAGVRPSIAIGAGAAVTLLFAALGWVVAGRGAIPEPRLAATPAPAPQRVDGPPARPAGVRFAGRLLEVPSDASSRDPAASSVPAPRRPEERPEPETRSAELVGLEREAARQAEAASFVDLEAIEAALAGMPHLPGEGEAELGRRLDGERERLMSDEFLLQYRLSQLFESTTYPPGFDVERDVVAPERQRVAALPAEDRVTEIRNALESWEPGRASPRFEGAPDPALSWQIGLPEL